MRIINPSEVTEEVYDLYKNGLELGKYVGFDCLKDLYSVKLGCTTYWTGSPTSGKTELLFETLMNLSNFYGWKHLIFAPETGNIAQIVAELANKYMRKPFYKKFPDHMTDKEVYTATTGIAQYFDIIEPDNIEDSMTMFDILNQSKKAIKNYQTISIDPWDELEHSFKDYSAREDEYLKFILSHIRRFARANNIHFNIVVHPRTPERKKDGSTSPATAYDISGGSKWFNKADFLISSFRPELMADGQPNANMVQVIILKAKPKHLGSKGTANLYFDIKKSRFYEKNDVGIIKYAEKEVVENFNQKSIDFSESSIEENVPF